MSSVDLSRLFDRDPPAAPDAERAVLGAILHDGRCLPDVQRLIEGPGAFADAAHAAIYESMLAIHEAGRTPDIVAVKTALSDRAMLEKVGGADALIALHESVVSASGATSHAKILREKAQQRATIAIASKILDRAYNSAASAGTITAEAAEELARLVRPAQDPAPAAAPCTAAQDLWAATPREIRRIYYSLKNPLDERKRGILLSDPCKLLLAYAIAGTLASKRIVVSNEHMLSVVEHFYTNHFVFFINNSGDSKTGTSGIIQEFVEEFSRHCDRPPCLESGMATGPVIVIKDCFGTHDERIKARAIGTGRILPPLANARKDAEPRREVTASDLRRAREEYKAEMWSARDEVRPMIFVVDELAEKLANVAKIANGALIDIHSSGPEVRTEGKYNAVGTCYGYGSAISIFGNMQKSLAADLFYNPKNAASGLQGRCLPLSNDFQADVVLGDHTAESQRGTAQWLAKEFGPMPINYIDARFPSFDDTGIRTEDASHGVEFNKFHILAQRLLAPLFVFGGPEVAAAAYGPCLRLLVDLFPHAFSTGVIASSRAQERSTRGRLGAIVARKTAGKDSIRTREIVQGFRAEERHGKTEEVNAYMEGLGWVAMVNARRGGEVVGWRRA